MRGMPGLGGVMGFVLAGVVAAGCAVPQNGLRAEGGRGETRVSSADRMLRWEAFPRERDASVFGKDQQRRIANVRYELRVWRNPARGHAHATGGTIEEPLTLTGLRSPEWRVPLEFEAGVEHRWAARARFELDGRTRVTQWTGLGYGPVAPEELSMRPTFVVEEARP